MIVVAVFSLAWFVVGILVGRRLPANIFAGSPARRGSGGGCIEMYVGNLAYDVSERDLRKMFEEHGTVVSIRLIKNRANGKSKGYGFVEVADKATAEASVKALHGTAVKGRKLIVNEAKSQPRSGE